MSNQPDDRARFFDSRAAYTMFVTTTTEKAAVAARVSEELPRLTPGADALRVFDAGMGDATVLANVMRSMHEVFTHVPLVVVGKEISVEDVRQALDKLPDRLHEHPELVFVVTNMTYREAPLLRPGPTKPEVAWEVTALEGSTTREFARQIRSIHGDIADQWRVTTSERTGNPIYERPAVRILYRKDREFILRRVIPDRLDYPGEYDLVIASQPYRARTSVESKVRNVVLPLARSLAPNGCMLGIHAHGGDPGLEIIRNLWPDEDPFQTDRHQILDGLARQADEAGLDLVIEPLSDAESIFRYDMHAMPVEAQEHIGTSSILAAWNAAAYVAQIDEERIAAAVESGAYIDATREVIERHGGVWFQDESYVIRRAAAG